MNQCIERIFRGYEGAGVRLESIMVVAHSMGGIVARAAQMLWNYRPGSVHTMITLNTPHRSHPFPCDSSLVQMYHALNQFYGAEAIEEGRGMAPTSLLISIAGGARDSTVPSHLTILRGIVPEIYHLNIMTTSIQGVWCQTDHLSILWCGQFVAVLVRSLVDMHDQSGTPLTISERRAIAWNHLGNVRGTGGILRVSSTSSSASSIEPASLSSLSRTSVAAGSVAAPAISQASTRFLQRLRKKCIAPTRGSADADVLMWIIIGTTT